MFSVEVEGRKISERFQQFYLFTKRSTLLVEKIIERFRQFYFFTKRSTLLVKTSRKTKFLHSFSVEQNCYLFCLCLSFRLKVKKRYLLLKKRSGIFSFLVNDILTSILSTLHPFLTLPNNDLKCERGIFLSLSRDLMKGTKRFLFCSWKRCSQKREEVPFWQLEVMLLKVQKRYLFKNIK